jgi:hypothetical protein
VTSSFLVPLRQVNSEEKVISVGDWILIMVPNCVKADQKSIEKMSEGGDIIISHLLKAIVTHLRSKVIVKDLSECELAFRESDMLVSSC